MAFLDDFGKAENDPGEWVDAGTDGERTVKVRVRTVPEDMIRALTRKYTKPEKVQTPEGIQTVQPVARDWQDNIDFNLERAKWAWVDCENFYVRVRDEDSGRFYAKSLGRNDQPFPVDEEICLDGKLTDGIREYVLKKNGAFRAFILQKSSDLAEEKTSNLRKLEGN